MSEARIIRIAVAQNRVCEDPGNSADLEKCGSEVRGLIRRAHQKGARLVHFPEGAMCSPHKLIMSVNGPEEVGPADWNRANWDALQSQLRATAALAKELNVWVVLGSVHRLTPPNRPHNSLYVIDDNGTVVTRYDERMLSSTKISHMYSPGSTPVTFEVDGFRFGCSLGMEVHFPELFIEYERLDVDCVLFSTVGPPTPYSNEVFATEAQAHAATNSYWVSYATSAQDAVSAPSGVISPEGQWLGKCPKEDAAAVVVVDLDGNAENFARPWRRKARSGIYDAHVVRDDPRSEERVGF